MSLDTDMDTDSTDSLLQSANSAFIAANGNITALAAIVEMATGNLNGRGANAIEILKAVLVSSNATAEEWGEDVSAQ
jgi:hypothetical protein